MNITPIPDRIARMGDEVLNTFTPVPTLIVVWDEYRSFLARLYCALECKVLGIVARLPDIDFDVSRCWGLLKKKFGDSAAQTGFEIARTGTEGGVLQLMRTVAELYCQEYAQNLINLAVGGYWSTHNAKELLADADEYIRKYNHILPSEITEGTGVRIQANFRKVLKQHPLIICQLRCPVR